MYENEVVGEDLDTGKGENWNRLQFVFCLMQKASVVLVRKIK